MPCTVSVYELQMEFEPEKATYLGTVALECFQCVTVQSLSVHLSSSTVVLLLRVVGRAAVLMEERQLNT